MHSADDIDNCPLVQWARHMDVFYQAHRRLALSVSKGGLDTRLAELMRMIKSEYPNQKLWFDFNSTN